jgi:shikimate kinase
MPTKTILLLVGPKGAGKTYLGTRLEREAGIPFVRVESIWLELARTKRLEGSALDTAGQERVLNEVETSLEATDSVVLESTGTAPWFPHFLAQLESLGRVAAIRVRAPAADCLARVRNRDSQLHIPVSDERVQEINAIAERIELKWALVVENNTHKDANSIVELIRSASFS